MRTTSRDPAFVPPEIAELTVVPLPHVWRWIAVAIAGLCLVGLAVAMVTNSAFQWHVVGTYLFHPRILSGLGTTIILTVVVMILASVGGTILALMLLSDSRFLSAPAAMFVWIFRGAPALVQLMLWYNLSLIFKTIGLWIPGVGMVFSVDTNSIMTPFVAAVIALSLHESGYMAEIVRGGLKSVPRGQTEAAACLGIAPGKLLRRIILPQAMRVIIPPTGNETINLLKTTSLVSIIAVGDLLYTAQSIYARTFETIPLLLVVTVWYLVVVSIMSIGQFFLERHFSKDQQPSRVALGTQIRRNLFRFRTKAVAP
ncbi:amino acid ABC transporter permease [Devosia sp. A369]